VYPGNSKKLKKLKQKKTEGDRRKLKKTKANWRKMEEPEGD
jgi:hypothetical protein